jgi:hypothetical protein
MVTNADLSRSHGTGATWRASTPIAPCYDLATARRASDSARPGVICLYFG